MEQANIQLWIPAEEPTDNQVWDDMQPVSLLFTDRPAAALFARQLAAFHQHQVRVTWGPIHTNVGRMSGTFYYPDHRENPITIIPQPNHDDTSEA